MTDALSIFDDEHFFGNEHSSGVISVLHASPVDSLGRYSLQRQHDGQRRARSPRQPSLGTDAFCA